MPPAPRQPIHPGLRQPLDMLACLSGLRCSLSHARLLLSLPTFGTTAARTCANRQVRNTEQYLGNPGGEQKANAAQRAGRGHSTHDGRGKIGSGIYFMLNTHTPLLQWTLALSRTFVDSNIIGENLVGQEARMDKDTRQELSTPRANEELGGD